MGVKDKDESKDKVLQSIKITKNAGIETELGGDVAFSKIEIVGASDAVGIIAAFVILAVTFGVFLAAGLPILTALIGLIAGLMCIFISSNFVDTPVFSLSLAAMIGLDVGIDYALFIISRYRENLSERYAPKEAVSRAMATAGSAVLFAGVTVIIALSGLSLVGVPFLKVMGLGGAAVVLFVVMWCHLLQFQR